MRLRLYVLATIATSGCGDNVLPEGEPLTASANLTIVAHPDDDLLFMQPDLRDAVLEGGATIVYVTAGNDIYGLRYTEARYQGLMAAYGEIGGSHDWLCGWIEIADHAMEHCRLDDARISLVFLGYPDGGLRGAQRDSLDHLWQGRVASATTISRRTATYTGDELVAVLSEIVTATAPATLRTLEVTGTHGNDHSDHMAVGALAVLATAATAQHPDVISYRGYNVRDEPVNADPALFERARDVLARYHGCANGCAPCGQPCTISAISHISSAELEWLVRRYAIGVRRRGEGQLRQDSSCIAAAGPGAGAVMVDCAAAPTWQLDDTGQLRSSDGLCLAVDAAGGIATRPCDGLGPGGRFFLDDEGHLWSGAVPPAGGMKRARLSCVGQTAGQLHAGPCSDPVMPSWELVRRITATPRTMTTLTRTGRAVRIGRFPSEVEPRLCAVESGGRGLMCAPGTPGGPLQRGTRIDSPDAPLAIDPASLTLGDVDGDGQIDACGADAGGLVCATAAAGYRAARWASVLPSTAPGSPSDRSLAIVRHGPGEAMICGLGDAGAVCASQNATALTDVRSTWPDRSASLWFADLDGDHQVDWCAATAAGPACGLAAHRDLTTAGTPWGYVAAGQIDGGVPDTDTAVFTDVDGDGRDDLCSLQGEVIACARSTGRGFAPRSPIAHLPAGMVASSLWAEPAGPGALPRLCAADAQTIACTD